MKNKTYLNKGKNIYLAPMDEINDIAFMLLCKKAGASRVYTEMIFPNKGKSLVIKGKPVIQIVCRNSRGLKRFMKKYDSRVSGWNLNLGCPGYIARKGKFGAFLRDLKLIEKILATMKANTKKSLSVKLRKTELTKKIVRIANKYCDEVVIHPRTVKQGYNSKPDIKFAESLKKYTSLPIIFSGDVSASNYKEILKKFDAVMIGRVAIGNPSVFSSVMGKKEVNFLDYLNLAKINGISLLQIKFQAINFLNRIPGGERYILKILKARSKRRIEYIFFYVYNNLKKWRKEDGV